MTRLRQRLLSLTLAANTPLLLRAEEDLADIRDPLWVWTTRETILLAAGLTLLAAIIGILAWRAARRKKPAETPTFQRTDIFTRTRDALTALEAQIDSLASVPFAVEVSGVMREFLEDTLDVPVTERTTEEFLTSLQNFSGFDEDSRNRLTAFLQQCDLVKYARQELAREARLTLLESARALVAAVEKGSHPAAASSPPTFS